jgi:hypothetical protein
MKEQKWQRRDRKYRKKRFGMKIDGKSVFTIRDEMNKRNKRKIKEKQRKRRKNERVPEGY